MTMKQTKNLIHKMLLMLLCLVGNVSVMAASYDFAVKNEDDKWEIPVDDIDIMAGFIYKAVAKSTKKDIIDYAYTLKNVEYNKTKLKNRLDDIFKGNYNIY